MFLKIKRLSPLLIASTGAVALTREIKETTPGNNNVATNEKPDPDDYSKTTGWERVKTLFATNEFGESSPDVVLISSSVIVGAMVGATMGVFRKSKKTMDDFMEKNDASKYQNITEARKHLSRLLTKEMLKGVLQYGPTFAFLVGGFSGTSTVVAAYRGKTGILEHVIAGMVIGALYRFNFGFRGMLVGFTTGTMFGAIYGVSTYLIIKLSGSDLEQARKDFHNLYYYNDRKIKKLKADYEMSRQMSSFEIEKAEKLRHAPITLDHIADDTENKEVA